MCEEEKYSAIMLIMSFLNNIGLSIEYTLLDEKTFCSGISLKEGRLYIDRGKLFSPGELLYQAGKIAVSPSVDRAKLNGHILHEPCDDMMVIAWCWAALKHLNLTSDVIFATSRYGDSSCEIIEKFSTGRSIGVPLLQWAGMTNEPTRNLNDNMVVFPAMIKWLRD
ncbi:hypothetical protein MD588_12810 [Photobacterium sp. SDRW27]|uniref:hypothetical protein n=1 Tax=Photobacterium obscurum TaxID=2829490 RepID=UPI002243739C|nr:hypothetical protein [Photobacterium obscurum]MCW8329690.1 hypothetical protein [Photobacterium obscurum]